MVVTAADKPRSMNRSCIQCRERKIKCDRLDPCTQCISKGAGDECKRELRKKRAKNKHPFPKRKSRTALAEPSAHISAVAPALPYTAQSGLDAAASMMSWADRPMTSASHHSDNSYTPSSSGGKAITPNTTSSAHDFSYFFGSTQDQGRVSATKSQTLSARLADEDDNAETTDSDTESSYDSDDSENGSTLRPDDRLQMLKANQLMQIQSTPQFRCPFALKDVYAEWRAMPFEKRRSLVQEVRDALPSLQQTLHLLHEVYVKRYHSIHGNIVHVPTIQVILTEILTEPEFEKRDRYAFGYITSALIVIFAALRCAPLDSTYSWSRRGSLRSEIEPLGLKGIRQRQRKLYNLVKRILRFESTFTFGSISELQTACLILACGKGSSSFLDSLADCAVRSALRMRIHRLGTFEKLHSPQARASQVVTGEMAVRCWWALVRRDWSQSNKHRTYRISPSQFNMRQPLNLFDDELLRVPCPRSHLRSTWTHVSYSFATIDFAIMTRTLVDQVNSQQDLDYGPESSEGWGLASVFGQRLSTSHRDSLDHTFQSLVGAFLAHYSLEARYDVIQLVDIERWLLHQRLFYLFLTLHMLLVSEATRPHGSLMYMASHILDIQDKVAEISTRLDNSYLTILQTLRACLVLLLDLFFTDAPVNIGGLSRLMTRRKISAAFEKLPADVLSSTNKVCVQLVQALLAIEEQHHDAQLGTTSSAMIGSAVADADRVTDKATLRSRWHATCQILDVLLNDGYWKSFRKNLLQLEHPIPDWLQKPLREETVEQLPGRSFGEIPSDSVLQTRPVATLADLAPSQPSFTPQLEHTSDAGTANAFSAPLDDMGLGLAFDPKMFEDFDVPSFDAPESSSQLPPFDVDLLSHQDLEGYGNSSQSIDFAKMLMEWRVEAPLPS